MLRRDTTTEVLGAWLEGAAEVGARPVGVCFDDASERALGYAALALDDLVGQRGSAGRSQGHRPVAGGTGGAVEPLAPREVLQMAVGAHGYEGNLSQVGRLALSSAVRASLAPARYEL